MPRVLIVDPNGRWGAELVRVFANDGLAAFYTSDVDHLEAELGDGRTDIVVVQTGSSGAREQLCVELRGGGFEGGLIVVGNGAVSGAVVGVLDAGADDYVDESLPVVELQARVRAVLRRTARHAPAAHVTTLSGLHVDEDTHTIVYGQVEVLSSGRDYDLLRLLIFNAGHAMSHRELLSAIWGEEWAGTSAVLSVAVSRLRERLATAGAPDELRSVWGVGYILAQPDAPRARPARA